MKPPTLGNSHKGFLLLDKKLLSKIRRVKNWPKKGVLFYDLNSTISSNTSFNYIIDCLSYECRVLCVNRGIQYNKLKIVGIESRGFIWASAVASNLRCGFVPIRKEGKIADSQVQNITNVRSEYSSQKYVLPKGCIKKNDAVIVIDDVLATGQTALGAVNMLMWGEANVIGACFILGIKKLKGHSVMRGIPMIRLADV